MLSIEMISNISQLQKYIVEELSNVSDSPHLEAEIIIGFVLKMSKESLIINHNNKVSQNTLDQIEYILIRRKSHIPLEYITSTKDFYSHTFTVDKNILIPRPETEILVEKVLLDLCKNDKKEVNILEIGIGSGCIFISIAYELLKKSNITYNFYLTDISAKAIKVAKDNLKTVIPHPTNITFKFVNTDILDDTQIKFDYIISNPPYIPTNELSTLQEEVKKEPLSALDGGESGLDIYSKILDKIKPNLLEISQIYFEIHSSKAKELSDVCREKLKGIKIEIIKDLNGLDRILKLFF